MMAYPIIGRWLLLTLLVTVIPAGMGAYRRRHPVDAPRPSHLLGIQMDIAIAVLGLLLLSGAIHWLKGFYS